MLKKKIKIETLNQANFNNAWRIITEVDHNRNHVHNLKEVQVEIVVI